MENRIVIRCAREDMADLEKDLYREGAEGCVVTRAGLERLPGEKDAWCPRLIVTFEGTRADGENQGGAVALSKLLRKVFVDQMLVGFDEAHVAEVWLDCDGHMPVGRVVLNAAQVHTLCQTSSRPAGVVTEDPEFAPWDAVDLLCDDDKPGRPEGTMVVFRADSDPDSFKDDDSRAVLLQTDGDIFYG